MDKIGVGVTEAGLKDEAPTSALGFLASLLAKFKEVHPAKKLSIINTDNFTGNGDQIKKVVTTVNSDPGFAAWCGTNVTFHNSMVDTIVAQRTGDANIPSAEAHLLHR